MSFTYKPHPFPQEIEVQVFLEQKGICCNPDCDQGENRQRKKLTKYDRPDHKVPQTKTNVRIYGEARIQSKENCWIPCTHCHANKKVWGKKEIKRVQNLFEKHSKSKLNGNRVQ